MCVCMCVCVCARMCVCVCVLFTYVRVLRELFLHTAPHHCRLNRLLYVHPLQTSTPLTFHIPDVELGRHRSGTAADVVDDLT